MRRLARDAALHYRAGGRSSFNKGGKINLLSLRERRGPVHVVDGGGEGLPVFRRGP
jgi:hypothetical protein